MAKQFQFQLHSFQSWAQERGEQVLVTDVQGLKTLQCRGDHHDPHLGHRSGCSGNLNSALALWLGIIRSISLPLLGRKSETLS